jgi:tetratricopeptide (TPR) repeat protein
VSGGRARAGDAAASDHDADLQRIDHDIAKLEDGARSVAADAEQLTRLAYRRHHRAALTGDPADLRLAERVVDDALVRVGPWPDLCILKGHLDLGLHRLEDVRRHLAMSPGLADSSEAMVLRADLALQEGDYESAITGYEHALVRRRSWDRLARLAHVAANRGDAERADRLFREAEDEITAKEMRSFAWVRLQRGRLAFIHGRYDDAWRHYRLADRAYSGYWLVHEHTAELLGARGEFDEAALLYEAVAARVPRPELWNALGDLYAFMGEPARARPWYERALAGYLESVHRGDVHYFHHLTSFYADVRQDGAQAVRWAQKDLQLRRGPSTQAALAWALYRAGRVADALELTMAALSWGVQDAQLLARAAAVYLAAGQVHESDQLLRRAAEVDPRHQDFRAHR